MYVHEKSQEKFVKETTAEQETERGKIEKEKAVLSNTN